MRVVVSYDVSSDESRRKIADALLVVLPRVQYSVFEGDVQEPVLRSAVASLLPLLDPATDSLRVYRLCAACARRMDLYGRHRTSEEGPVQIL
jgi:CRISPR-associated protein Cas2